MRGKVDMLSKVVGVGGALGGFAIGLLSFTANAAEAEYLGLFNGTWSGGGTVVKGSIPWQVSCQAIGQPGENHIVITGDCSVAIINVPISADITYDPDTGLYSGTYIGAKVGPAHLSGKRSGNVVNLTITWPKPVNGDTRAQMIIENDGRGELRIVVTDNTAPGGPELTTHDLVLSQL
jgi:hypothetical protein